MPASPEPQRRLGSAYILDEMIGSGVQGTVWKGHKEDSDQPLAFKILRRDLTSEPGVVDAFLRERETLRRITSPNVIEVHDIVAENGTLGLVMDYVDGGDLDDLIRSRGALEPAMIAYLGANIAAGVGAVHAAGVVHGDIKPANILIDSSTTPGTPKIADFGIARICDSTAATRTAVGMGTLVYMAPEASAGVPPSPAKDVYALGIVLYQLACGVPPFVGSPAYLVKMHSQMAPGRPAGIPDPLWDLISRMLDKDPAKRPSVLEVYQTLAPLTTALAGRPAAPTLTEPPAASPLPDREGAQTIVAPPNTPGAPAPAGGQQVIRLTVQPHAQADTTATGPAPPPADPAPPRQERERGRRPALAALLVLALMIGVVGGGVGAYHLLGVRGASTSTTSETSPRRADPSAGGGAPAGRGAASRGAVDLAAGSRAAQTAADGLIQSLVMADEVDVWNRTSLQARQQLEGVAPVTGYQSAREYIVRSASASYSVDNCAPDAAAAGPGGEKGRFSCQVRFSCQSGSCPTAVLVFEPGAEPARIDSISFQ